MHFVQLFLVCFCALATFLHAGSNKKEKESCYCPSELSLMKARTTFLFDTYNPFSTFASTLELIRINDGAREHVMQDFRKLNNTFLLKLIENQYKTPTNIPKKDPIYRVFQAIEKHDKDGYLTQKVKNHFNVLSRSPVNPQSTNNNNQQPQQSPSTSEEVILPGTEFLRLNNEDFKLLFQVAHRFQDTFVAYIHFLIKQPNPCPGDLSLNESTTSKTKGKGSSTKSNKKECEETEVKDDHIEPNKNTTQTSNINSKPTETSSASRKWISGYTFMALVTLLLVVFA